MQGIYGGKIVTREREKELENIFKFYKANKKELNNKYSVPVPSGVAYDKISVQTDKSKNGNELLTLEYISKREELFKKVFIVDEVLNWFKLEGHGREKFVKELFIEHTSWRRTSFTCHISEATIALWKKEVLLKAEMVAKWVNFL